MSIERSMSASDPTREELRSSSLPREPLPFAARSSTPIADFGPWSPGEGFIGAVISPDITVG